jgi:hypothetical protein
MKTKEELEHIARKLAERTAPNPFQSVQEYSIKSTVNNLLASDYVRFKKENPKGDYEKYLESAHRTVEADKLEYVQKQTKKTLEGFARDDAAEKVLDKTVGEIFEALFLPIVNSQELKGWDKVEVRTDEGIVNFDTRSEIIARAGEWSESREGTRKYLINKYNAFGYEKQILNKQGQRIARVEIRFTLR